MAYVSGMHVSTVGYDHCNATVHFFDIFDGNICVKVIEKMIYCSSVCNGALLLDVALYTIDTVCVSLSLSWLEQIFSTTFFVLECRVFFVLVIVLGTGGAIVFHIKTDYVCKIIRTRFFINITLWDMLFNFF